MATDVELDRSGRARLPQAAIIIHAPGWSGTARVLEPAPSATATRGDGDDFPLTALDGVEMNIVAYVEIEAAADQRGSHGTRGQEAAGAINVSLDAPRPDRNYALLQRDPSGLLHWVFPEQKEAEAVSFALAEPTEKGVETDLNTLTMGPRLTATGRN